MEYSIKLEIGQKVTWKSGCFDMIGVVYEDFGKKVSIITHFRNECPIVQQIEVDKKLLTKI